MCTDEEFTKKVAAAANLLMLRKSLCDEDYRSDEPVKRRIEQLGLSTAHFTRNKISDNELIAAVADSFSMGEVLVRLGVSTDGKSHAHFSKRARDLGLSFAHFRRRKKVIERKKASDLFTIKDKNSKRTPGASLKKAMIESGIKEECAKCGGVKHLKEKLPLQVDHKNEIRWDDRLENLWLLCPNCHTQKTAKFIESRKSDKQIQAQQALEERTKKKATPAILVLGKQGDERTKTILLRACLINSGVAYKCGKCFAVNHQNEPLRLEIDHKNENNWDNRLENLWFLCPNCHAIKTQSKWSNEHECSDKGAKKPKNKPPKKSNEIRAERKKPLKETKIKTVKPVLQLGQNGKWPSVEDLVAQIESGQSYEAIGRELEVSGNAVKAYLRRRKVVLPQRRKESPKETPWPDDAKLLRMIVEENKTYAEVARGLGVTTRAVTSRLTKAGYELPRRLATIEWPEAEELYKRWISDDERCDDIAAELGTRKSHIRRYLKSKGYELAKRNQFYNPLTSDQNEASI